MSEVTYVNGKHYPMWQQFVDNKKSWIGGVLQETGSVMGGGGPLCEITDITLTPNDVDSAMFMIHGKRRDNGEEWNCGADVRYLGIGADQKKPWLIFSTTFGDRFRIHEKGEQHDE